MIEKFNDWDDVKTSGGEFEKLPAGAYEAVINGVKIESGRNHGKEWRVLVVRVEITAGKYRNYFGEQFKASTFEGKKYKGVCRIFIPTNDGSDKDQTTKGIFKSNIQAVEQSNSGYKWNWDENSIVNKAVGILVRDKEYDFNGKQGFAPEIFRLVSLESVRSGKLSTPAPKLIKPETSAPYAPPVTNANAANDVDDYPF